MSHAITMTAAAWDTIRQEVSAVADGAETGGILLGHDLGDTLHVTIAGDPGPNAKRTPDRFLRDRDHAEQLAAQAWEKDRAQWVGEWHTHPATPPVPSPIDLTSYARHLHDPDLNFDRFVSVIIGRDGDNQTGVAGWIITDGAATLVPLRIGELQ
ncbi:hypothetical protein NBCG_01651 [Nocardioidaceae bacterium Broad-1]|nr:hypothetical protein NBCG_01651 [Nocardioidaceae bacterium Broad-1]